MNTIRANIVCPLASVGAVLVSLSNAGCRDFHLVTIEYHEHPAEQVDEANDKQTEQEIIEGLIGGVS